jgi:hypothetical protein
MTSYEVRRFKTGIPSDGLWWEPLPDKEDMQSINQYASTFIQTYILPYKFIYFDIYTYKYILIYVWLPPYVPNLTLEEDEDDDDILSLEPSNRHIYYLLPNYLTTMVQTFMLYPTLRTLLMFLNHF